MRYENPEYEDDTFRLLACEAESIVRGLRNRCGSDAGSRRGIGAADCRGRDATDGEKRFMPPPRKKAMRARRVRQRRCRYRARRR